MSDPHTNVETPPTPESNLPKHAPEFAAASQPSYARTLLLGPGGLRPGWGFAFYVAMYYTALALAGVCVSEAISLWPQMSPRLLDAISELAGVISAFVPALILGAVQKSPWRWFGLPLARAFGKLFWLGTLWGFSAITALILILHGLHDFDYGPLALHGVRLVKLAAYWSVLFVLVGLSEEFLFRGYSQFTLARGIGFWPAAVILSATFGLIHLGNEGERWLGLLTAAAIGFFFCLTLRRTGSLWFAVGFHAAWDWGQTFFYSVPDSGLTYPRQQLLRSSLHGSPWLTGGSVGPEGSVLCLLVIVLTGLAFARLFPLPATEPAVE